MLTPTTKERTYAPAMGLSQQNGTNLPLSPSIAASVGVSSHEPTRTLSSSRVPASQSKGQQIRTTFADSSWDGADKVFLELKDGTVYEGVSFGAEKSAAGELVFQTGMVGYPESVTDPSYRGQILVITFPLVGNYGVPSREVKDELLGGLAKHFESSAIHIAGLVVASYSGQDFSHYLAKSSFGTWLQENGVPAICGVDTRALTKRIRDEGSMLGRMLRVTKAKNNGVPNGDHVSNGIPKSLDWREDTDLVKWIDQNSINLVKEGGMRGQHSSIRSTADIFRSLSQGATVDVPAGVCRTTTPVGSSCPSGMRGRWIEIQSASLSTIPWG